MLRILLLTVFIVAALSTAVPAIEIDPQPVRLLQNLIGQPPIDYSDESGHNWVPKTDLGLTFAQATKGLEGVIPKVIRWIEPSGFQGESNDGKIRLSMWGTEAAIKTVRLEVPFSVDPYRFSLGSWADTERPKEIIISFLNGAFPSDSRENREWVEDYMDKILRHPLRNSFKNNEIETQDGRVLFENQKPLVKKISSNVEATLGSGLFGKRLTLEITPPRTKSGAVNLPGK